LLFIPLAALLVTIIGGIMGVFYRLISKNVAQAFMLTQQENSARADVFDEKLAAQVLLFQQKLDAATESYAARVDGVWREFKKEVKSNSDQDNINYDRLKSDLSLTNTKLEGLDKDFRKLLAQLPAVYVQRDDWIRGFNQIDGKIDSFAEKTDARLSDILSQLTATRERVAEKGK